MQVETMPKYVIWPGAQIIKLSGADARTWLQGQVTNDLSDLLEGQSVAACFVKSTGQLQSKLAVQQLGENLLISIDKPNVLWDRLNNFVILEDVAGEMVSETVAVTIDGTSATSGIQSWRLGAGTYDNPAGKTQLGSELTWEQVLTLSLEQGWPIPDVDADARTLPPELGEGFLKAHVHFEKGCYVGQEVLQRIHSRGHVNKSWRVISTLVPAMPGAEVLSKTGQKIGSIIRKANSQEHGWLASAMLREAEPGDEVQIGNTTGIVRI